MLNGFNFSKLVLLFTLIFTYKSSANQWRAEGGVERAPAPGIHEVKFQKLKCYNQMTFPIANLLIGKC